ncbi:MAG: formate dehydrogenase-N subunit alpha [Nitrososphaerota archaeon]|nr:formate dehydrogenase-N subunit alpha [Nitrososphaerota archaeon]
MPETIDLEGQQEEKSRKRGLSLSRRGFLKGSAAVGATAFLAQYGLTLKTSAQQQYALHKPIGETLTICPFCATGCSIIASADSSGNVITLEGNPDSPINSGALCPKGQSSIQLLSSPKRLYQPLYREPNSSTWSQISWDDAFSQIASRLQRTRDSTFQTTNSSGVTVNRTTGLAWLGSAHISNEDAYLIHKLARALGIIYFDHAARICHSPTAGGLAPTYGRGAQTNNPVDLRNADVVMFLGSNQAEAHPLSFKHVMDGKKNNPNMVLITVDPHFSRTAKVSDIYARIRVGTDIAFLGYLINYAFQNNRVNMEYVTNYTNGPALVNTGYSFDPASGLFSGYNSSTRTYNASTWAFQTETVTVKGQTYSVTKKDMTMTDPNCVFQLTKAHYARYTRDLVSSVTGIPGDVLDNIANIYTQAGDPSSGKTSTIVWSLGLTLHNHGSQNVRAVGELQLLLGMIGMVGGGANVMRGHSNVQGATDMYVLFDQLPGYLPAPDETGSPNFQAWVKANAPTYGYKNNYNKFLVSLLKAWFGDAATSSNNFVYDFIPKKFGDHSFMKTFDLAAKGQIQGLVILGQNPAAMLENTNAIRGALGSLKWLVVIDPFESETADFWKAPGLDPSKIGTEVYFLPSTTFLEHDGTKTNTGRWIQWMYQVTTPRGSSKTDGEIISRIALGVKQLYSSSTDPKDLPIQSLVWNYGPVPSSDDILKEVNGFHTADSSLVTNFTQLAADGSTASGNWIYSGVYGGGVNHSKSIDFTDPSGLGLYPNWSYAWPLNRRIMYNRASCDLQGNPRDPKRAVIWWDSTKKQWTGWDVPDFLATKSPSTPFDPSLVGLAALSGTDPFIMQPDGTGWIFAPVVTDGPLAEHYEPYDHPVANLFHPNGAQIDPVAHYYFNAPNDAAQLSSGYNVIGATGRLVEHWHAFSNYISWPVELVPEMFVEISSTLAKTIGVASGDYVKVSTPRGQLKLRAYVTGKVGPLVINGETFEVAWFPIHGAFNSLVPGQDNINLLTPSIGDGYQFTPEAKPLLVKVEKWTG